MLLVAALVAAPALLSGPSRSFEVSAAYVSRAGAQGEVAVSFTALDPDVRINRVPAPRLKLDPAQTLLVVAPAPAEDRAAEGANKDKYLDVTWPVVFPVSLSSRAPKGGGMVKGTVTYFYCSKREGWCRKGTADVEFPLAAR